MHWQKHRLLLTKLVKMLSVLLLKCMQKQKPKHLSLKKRLQKKQKLSNRVFLIIEFKKPEGNFGFFCFVRANDTIAIADAL